MTSPSEIPSDSLTWETNVRTLSQILGTPLVFLGNIDNIFRPLLLTRVEADTYELSQNDEEVTTYGSFEEEKESRTDIFSHVESNPRIDDYYENDIDSYKPSREEMVEVKKEADTYDSSGEENVTIKMEHTQEEMNCNSYDSVCEEKCVLPVIVSTCGSYYQHYAEDSQQGN